MEVVEKHKRIDLAPLFPDFHWNFLPTSILEGQIGQALADDLDDPKTAVLELPALKLSILGGDASGLAGREYLSCLPTPSGLFLAAEGWGELVEEVHPGKVWPMTRYAFTSENLDREMLQSFIVRLPERYQLAPLDIQLARQLAAEKSEFSVDHLVNFESPEDFVARGFGYCVLEGDQIVCVATTFAICEKGVEIQINTRKKYRGQGLASAVAASLILHSLEQGLVPNWDAATEISAALAEKLGYTPQGTYEMYLVVGSAVLVKLAKTTRKLRAALKK